MTNEYTYNEIVKKANCIKQNVKQKYKIGEPTPWSYYIAKEVLQRSKKVTKIGINGAENSIGNDFGRQLSKAHYLDMAERFTKFVEKNKKLPTNIGIVNKKMRVSDYVYMFARILAYYDENKKLPNEVNINSKAFTKPTETGNEVFDYFVKKTGFKPTCLDDVCDYIIKHFTYEFYYDDHKSNKEVIDTKAGNCTDLLQFLVNMAEALGYKWEIHHVRCNQSGVGHVYGRFKKAGVNNDNYFVRDIACIADESRYCVWCEAGNGGTLLAVNPSWFLENLRR